MSNRNDFRESTVPGEDHRLNLELDALERRAPEQPDEPDDSIIDSWITTQVRTKCVGRSDLLNSYIIVDTRNRVVRLSGRVATHAARFRVVDIAEGIEGVMRVIDALDVVPIR